LGHDGAEGPLNGALDPFVKQEQLFETPLEDVDAVLEVGLAVWLGRSREMTHRRSGEVTHPLDRVNRSDL
jgi:hypothetical protein